MVCVSNVCGLGMPSAWFWTLEKPDHRWGISEYLQGKSLDHFYLKKIVCNRIVHNVIVCAVLALHCHVKDITMHTADDALRLDRQC